MSWAAGLFRRLARGTSGGPARWMGAGFQHTTSGSSTGSSAEPAPPERSLVYSLPALVRVLEGFAAPVELEPRARLGLLARRHEAQGFLLDLDRACGVAGACLRRRERLERARVATLARIRRAARQRERARSIAQLGLGRRGEDPGEHARGVQSRRVNERALEGRDGGRMIAERLVDEAELLPRRRVPGSRLHGGREMRQGL